MSKISMPHSNQNLVPFLTVQDINRAVDFYQKAFGFELVGDYRNQEDSDMAFVQMKFNGALMMFREEGGRSQSKSPASLNAEAPAWFILYCDDVDAQFKQAVDANAEVFHEPFDAEWGERMCKVADPDRHSWSFVKKI